MANMRRDASKERFWRDMLRRFVASGLSVRAFCKRERLTESAFYAWRRTIDARSHTGSSRPSFVPAVMTSTFPRPIGNVFLYALSHVAYSCESMMVLVAHLVDWSQRVLQYLMKCCQPACEHLDVESATKLVDYPIWHPPFLGSV